MSTVRVQGKGGGGGAEGGGEGWVAMDRHALLRIAGTETRVDRGSGREIKVTPKLKAKEQKRLEKEKADKSELKTRYTSFLTNHLSSLVKVLNESNPDDVAQFLRSGEHQHDRLLLNLLANQIEETGLKGATHWEVDAKKIEAFLNKPKGEGIRITTQVLEQDMAIKQAALAYFLTLFPPGERIAFQKGAAVRLGIQQGKFNYLGHKLADWLNVPYDRTGLRPDPNALKFPSTTNTRMRRFHVLGALGIISTGAGVAGFAATGGNPLGYLAASQGVNIAYLLGRSAFSGGVELRQDQRAGALNVLLTNEVEKRYVKEMFNVDISNFALQGNKVVDRRVVEPNYQPKMLGGEAVLESLLGEMHTRELFYQTLGVPAEKIDALPEQFLYDREFYLRRRGKQPGLPEQINADYLQKTNRLFFETEYTVGGVRYRGMQDRTGNYNERFNAAANRWEVNPGFNLDTNGLATVDNLKRYREARCKVLGEDLQKFIHDFGMTTEFKDVFKRGKSGEVITLIGEKITSRQSGELLTAEQKQYTDRIEKLTAEDGLLAEQKTPLDEYKRQLTELEKTRQAAQDEFGVSSVADLNAQILLKSKAAKDVLDPVALPPNGSLMYQKLKIKEGIATAITAEMTASKINPKTDPDGSRAREIIERKNAEKAAEIANIDEQLTDLAEQKTRLSTLRDTIKTNEENLGYAKDVVKNAAQIVDGWLTGYVADHAGITGLNGVNGVVLTDAVLATEPVDEILSRLSIANPGAWPPEQNSKPEVKARVLNVMMEIRMRIANPASGVMSVNLGNLIIAGLSEGQIRQMKAADVVTFATANGVPVTTIIEAAALIKETQDRLNLKLDAGIKALDDRKKAINSENTDQTWRKERAKKDFEDDIKWLNFVKPILEGQVDIYNRIRDRFTEELVANMDFFMPVDPANPPGPLKPYERNMMYQPRDAAGNLIGPPVHVPRGYLEIMDAFFDYRMKPNGDALLREASAYFTPELVATLLDGALFGGALQAAGNLDIQSVLQRMRTEVLGDQLLNIPRSFTSSHEIRQGAQYIINTLADNVIKMP